ncbi:hypothetical protein VOLCADRAFT_108020 [Volvox carteri f. nagariensis]|uniref:SAM domain-containing protein n=1 Tax=Volvox carteri f. nagariensis TaxID=3068 RepID=D8UHT3_VOLCA|nr:uncharacterized protein VOLCADRAFT_108020 [Volvox carteri f. nagariensis]EFJ40754.1 hypothetical protein VOLCADRAFT_108020 [Volvox carteri f. nagariensis]|eukprot:XP_002958220.1 hypothetical protein VOLCADRAFT_108020 [Volvox carteri f. nagariensis]
MAEADYLTRLTVRRLAELNATRARVEALEARAVLAEEYEAERKKLALLQRLQDKYGGINPIFTMDAAIVITELREHLQAVYDADLLADSTLRAITMLHAVAYATRTMDRFSEPGKYAAEGNAGVLELGASTLAMFSTRAGSSAAFTESCSVPVLVKLLSPLYPPVVVVNIANAIGNLAEDLDIRLALRSGGGVGALVRLLRPDCESSVQAAAAGALSLLSARDIVVQDSVRYLGGIDLLVDLLVSADAYTAEAARYCLMSLRRGNTKNQAEVIASIRANTSVVRNVRRVDPELLRFEEGTPRVHVTSYTPVTSYTTPTKARLRPTTADSYRRPGDSSTMASALARSVSPGRYKSPLAAALSSTHTPSTNTRTSLEREFASASVTSPIDNDLLKRKHMIRYSSEELVALLQDLGFDKLDLRPVKVHHVAGVDLLDMTEDEMIVRLLLPRHKVRKLRALQRAVALYDRIATLPRQGRLSEVELRLFLANQGCSTLEVDKIIRLFRSLVHTDKLDFVTFWDFVTAYDWIAQAFRIYNIPV